jgi:uncharacterized protein YdeI (YjbR/CyaY-like superfamily)
MSAKAIKTLEVQSRQEWRNWLREHHDSESEIWLIFNKRHTGVTSISYNDASRRHYALAGSTAS